MPLKHHHDSCSIISIRCRARSIVATAGLYLQLPCVLLGVADFPALYERRQLVEEFLQTLKTSLCSAVKLFCCKSNPFLASSVGGDGQSVFVQPTQQSPLQPVTVPDGNCLFPSERDPGVGISLVPKK